MKNTKVDFILDIVESIVCLIGVIVFSITAVEVGNLQRFVFIIADFYCAIKLTNCVDGIISFIMSRNNSVIETKQIDKIMYWS